MAPSVREGDWPNRPSQQRGSPLQELLWSVSCNHFPALSFAQKECALFPGIASHLTVRSKPVCPRAGTAAATRSGIPMSNDGLPQTPRRHPRRHFGAARHIQKQYRCRLNGPRRGGSRCARRAPDQTKSIAKVMKVSSVQRGSSRHFAHDSPISGIERFVMFA